MRSLNDDNCEALWLYGAQDKEIKKSELNEDFPATPMQTVNNPLPITEWGLRRGLAKAQRY
jgi:hypothetical protein